MTPLDLVRHWVKRLPGCYDQLDEFRKAEVCWPDYCVLPVNAACSYLASKDISPGEGSSLTACWLWRQNKVIFRFDENLVEMLAESIEDTDILPAELLLHPPYPTVYIKAPNLIEGRDGFFYFVDYDVNSGRTELNIVWLTPDGVLPQVLHLVPGGTIKECTNDMLRTVLSHTGLGVPSSLGLGSGLAPLLREAASLMQTEMLKAISLLLYLVSQNADITDDQPYKKKRRPYIVDTAKEIHTFSVGLRIGATIRKSAQGTAVGTGLGSRKRPHSRRGHWHHFWTGPKGEQKLVLKWLAPMYINGMQFNEEDIVVYPVKAPRR